MTLNLYFHEFTENRRIMRNVSRKTLLGYKHAWNAYGPYLGILDLQNPALPLKMAVKQATHKLRYRAKDANERFSEGTINTYLTVVNAFFAWLHEEDYLDRLIKFPKLQTVKKIRKTIGQDMIDKLKDFKPVGVNQARLKVIINCCLDCGLRLSEVRKLKVSDIDYENELLKVTGKGNKQRLVPFSKLMGKIFYKYCKSLKGEYLFVTNGNKLYSARNMARDLVVLCDRLGLEQFTFHQLRHTFATSYLQKGGDIARLRKILGHSSIVVTQVYEHMNPDDLKRGFDNLTALRVDLEAD